MANVITLKRSFKPLPRNHKSPNNDLKMKNSELIPVKVDSMHMDVSCLKKGELSMINALMKAK